MLVCSKRRLLCFHGKETNIIHCLNWESQRINFFGYHEYKTLFWLSFLIHSDKLLNTFVTLEKASILYSKNLKVFVSFVLFLMSHRIVFFLYHICLFLKVTLHKTFAKSHFKFKLLFALVSALVGVREDLAMLFFWSTKKH